MKYRRKNRKMNSFLASFLLLMMLTQIFASTKNEVSAVILNTEYEMARQGRLASLGSYSITKCNELEYITYENTKYIVANATLDGKVDEDAPVFFYASNKELISSTSLYQTLFKLYIMGCEQDKYENLVAKRKQLFKDMSNYDHLRGKGIDYMELGLKLMTTKRISFQKLAETLKETIFENGILFADDVFNRTLNTITLSELVFQDANECIKRAESYYSPETMSSSSKHITYNSSENVDTLFYEWLKTVYQLENYQCILAETGQAPEIIEGDNLAETFYLSFYKYIADVEIEMVYNFATEKMLSEINKFVNNPYFPTLASLNMDHVTEIQKIEEYGKLINDYNDLVTAEVDRLYNRLDYISIVNMHDLTNWDPHFFTSLTLESSKTLYTGDIDKLSYRFTPGSADAGNLQWKSSKPSIVKVTKDGKITALKPGKAVITVKAKDDFKKSSTCEITVLDAFTLKDKSLTLNIGESCTIKPDSSFTSGFQFKSSNKKAVTVSKNGLVKAVAQGTSTITVTHGGTSKTVKVTVKKPKSVKFAGKYQTSWQSCEIIKETDKGFHFIINAVAPRTYNIGDMEGYAVKSANGTAVCKDNSLEPGFKVTFELDKQGNLVIQDSYPNPYCGMHVWFWGTYKKVTKFTPFEG